MGNKQNEKVQNERVPSLTVLILLISVGRGDLLGAHQYLVVRVDQSNTTHTSRCNNQNPVY